MVCIRRRPLSFIRFRSPPQRDSSHRGGSSGGGGGGFCGPFLGTPNSHKDGPPSLIKFGGPPNGGSISGVDPEGPFAPNLKKEKNVVYMHYISVVNRYPGPPFPNSVSHNPSYPDSLCE